MVRAPNAAGLTLVELLVALAVTAALLAALASTVATTLATWRRATTAVAATDELLAALDQIARDVRVAGYDPARRGHPALVTAARRRIVLAADLDGDGRIDRRSRERVTYRRSRRGDLLRVLGRQAMPIASHLAPRGLEFTFRDRHDAPVDPGDDPERIRTVTAILTTRDAGRVVGGARLLNR